MERRVPVRRLNSVDLPTFGRPRITTVGIIWDSFFTESFAGSWSSDSSIDNSLSVAVSFPNSKSFVALLVTAAGRGKAFAGFLLPFEDFLLSTVLPNCFAALTVLLFAIFIPLFFFTLNVSCGLRLLQ